MLHLNAIGGSRHVDGGHALRKDLGLFGENRNLIIFDWLSRLLLDNLLLGCLFLILNLGQIFLGLLRRMRAVIRDLLPKGNHITRDGGGRKLFIRKDDVSFFMTGLRAHLFVKLLFVLTTGDYQILEVEVVRNIVTNDLREVSGLVGFAVVPLPVVNFLDSAFPEVGTVDSLGVVVRDFGGLTGLGNAEGVLVDESYEFSALCVSDLYVLSYHVCGCELNDYFYRGYL